MSNFDDWDDAKFIRSVAESVAKVKHQQPEVSETPKTDAAALNIHQLVNTTHTEHTHWVSVDFARGLERENMKLLTVLKGLYHDQMDYIRINNLCGAEENHWMKAARDAISYAETKP